MTNAEKDRPFWFALIYRWKATGRGTTGLTLPFLVGALHFEGIYADHHLSDHSALFYLLTDFQRMCPKPLHVEISECVNLHEPVAGLYPQLYMAAAEATEVRDGNRVLYIRKKYCREPDIESAAKALWGTLKEPISERRFSCVGKQLYVRFSTTDQTFIEQTKHWMAQQR